MKLPFLRSRAFWSWAIFAGLLSGAIFAWELGGFPFIPFPPRPIVTQNDLLFTSILIALIALNAGLFNWRRKFGTCPRGVRRATGIGGTIGAAALLCPACLLLPISLFGISMSFAILGPFLPLLRALALVLLLASALLLLKQ